MRTQLMMLRKAGIRLQIEDLLEIKTWGQLAFDPVRPKLYYTESVPDKASNRMHHRIMSMPWGHRDKPSALTQGSSDTRPLPSPDGRWLAFLSRRSEQSQVWRLPLEGGEAEQITFIQGGVKDFAWAPSGEALVVIAHISHGLLEHEKTERDPSRDADPNILEQYYNRDVKHITHQYYKLDGAGFFDEGRDQLVWVEIETGHLELLTSGFDNFAEPLFSPDGDRLYFLHRAYDPEGSHPDIVRVEQLLLKTRQRTTLPLPDWSISGISLDEEGRRLAFCASNPLDHGYGLTVLYTWDLKDQVLHDLSSVLDRPVGDHSGTDVPANSSAAPVWRQSQVLMLLSDQGRVGLAAFGDGTVRRLWNKPRVVYDFAAQGDRVVLAVSDPSHPSGLVFTAWDSADELVQWADVPWSREEGPREPDEIWATEGDGTRVHTWCIKPARQEHSVPAILEIHGGPMSMYGYRYHHEFQCLAAQGYAVVYTNPRGSVGYGNEFCRTIMGQWGDQDYRDLMAGLDSALAQWPMLDAARLGVAGGSYGGFMVNWIISHNQRFKAAVTMRSVVNRLSAMGSSDMGWLRVPQYGEKAWWEDPDPYWQQSPLRYASAIETPLLIEHQEQDYRLPIEQGEQLYSALKYLGRPAEMVLYPNESHGMSRTGQPWHRVHRLRTIVGWFDRHLRQDR